MAYETEWPPGLIPPDEPIYGLPPDEYQPIATYSLGALAEGHDWSHDFLGIPELHAKGFLGAGVLVCVVDTGVDYEHEDLAGQVLKELCKDFTGSQFGFKDVQGHGTWCSAAIGAAQNEKGLRGVAPACRLMHAKALNDSGSGASRWIADAIRHGADSGADIISLSLGGPGAATVTRQAVQYAISKGCWVFCAAGNDGKPANNYPGHFPESIAVAAVDKNGQRASFSTINQENDAAAPGVKMTAATPGNNYSEYSGTSMATPTLAGCAALVRAALKANGKPMPSQQGFLEALSKTCKDIAPAGKDQNTGWGVPDTKALLQHYGVWAAPPPPPPDEIVIRLKKGQTARIERDES